MGNNRFQWPTVHKSWKVSIFNYSGTPSGAGRASNKDLVGGKHRTIRKNKGWSCSSAKPHYEDAHWSTGLGRWQFGPTHPSSRTSYAGKRKKKKHPRTADSFTTVSHLFLTFSYIFSLDANPFRAQALFKDSPSKCLRSQHHAVQTSAHSARYMAMSQNPGTLGTLK